MSNRRLGNVAACFGESNYDDEEREAKLQERLGLIKTQQKYVGGFDSDQIKTGRHYTVKSTMKNLHSFKDQLKDLQTKRHLGAVSTESETMVYGHTPMGNAIVNPVGGNETGNNSMISQKDDDVTTNLYVAQINPCLKEKELIDLFGQYGALASLKVLYPKSDDDRLRQKQKGNCAFVCYMDRTSAEEAKLDLHDKVYRDFKLRVNWGKLVKIPLTPIYLPEEIKNRLKLPEKSNFPFNAIKSSRSDKFRDASIKVVPILDKKIATLVHRTIEFVIKYGAKFEAELLKKEKGNVNFKFLTDHNSPEHTYYRWKLWSLSHGDSLSNWSEEPFRMFIMGPWWLPPAIKTYGMKNQKYRVNKLKNLVGDKALHDEVKDEKVNNYISPIVPSKFNKLFDQLSGLKEPKKEKVGELMTAFIDNADFAHELSTALASIFRVSVEVDLIQTLSWLYLIYDILENIQHSKYGYRYKSEMDKLLPAIFHGIGRAACKPKVDSTKIKRLKNGVNLVIEGWMNKENFTPSYCQRLVRIFNNIEKLHRNEVLPPANKSLINALNKELNKIETKSKVDSKGNNLDSLPPSIQKQLLKAQVNSNQDDDEDIDGVPLYDVKWKNKDRDSGLGSKDDRDSRSRRDRSDKRDDRFKKSSWDEVDRYDDRDRRSRYR